MSEHKNEKKRNNDALDAYLYAIEYIERETALSALKELPSAGGCSAVDRDDVESAIMNIPIADVEEVRHGEWKEDTEYYDDDYSECNVRKVFCCSLCGRTEKRKEPYCNCGAKMDGERREG